MKLLFAVTEFPPGPGGIGVHAHQLCTHLAGMGWEITVLAAQEHAEGKEIERFNAAQPFPTYSWPRGGAAKFQALRGCIARFRPDLIVASGSRAVWLTATAAGNTPWYAIGHGSEFAFPSAWRAWLVRRAFSRAAGVICVSRFTWGRMIAAGVRPRAGTVVPNGADPVRFAPGSNERAEEVRRELGIGGAPLLLTVGNVSERKGQEVVVRALPAVPEAVYVAAGLPSRKRELESLAAELGVAGRARFPGRVDAARIVDLVNACDVFVMTSRMTGKGDFEGFGIAAIEAALCGKPAVVSNCGGLPEAVADGESGLCVPENDPDATAAALRALIGDPARRRRMGEAARTRALAGFTWAHCAAQCDGLFRAAVRGTGARGAAA